MRIIIRLMAMTVALASVPQAYALESGILFDVTEAGLHNASTVLPVFDWMNGKTETSVRGELYSFYERGRHTAPGRSKIEGSSTSDYWYGGSLHPLVVKRDGVTYRMIGKAVVEELEPTGDIDRSYLFADHAGSTRMVANGEGNIVASLGYDGDWGYTCLSGQPYAATDASMTGFYRFQGQEQEVFPLAELGINDAQLAAWINRLQLYHFPHRDYSAGVAAFLQTDPVPKEDSLYRAFAANPANFTDETGAVSECCVRAVSVPLMFAVDNLVLGSITLAVTLSTGASPWLFVVPPVLSAIHTYTADWYLTRNRRQTELRAAAELRLAARVQDRHSQPQSRRSGDERRMAEILQASQPQNVELEMAAPPLSVVFEEEEAEPSIELVLESSARETAPFPERASSFGSSAQDSIALPELEPRLESFGSSRQYSIAAPDSTIDLPIISDEKEVEPSLAMDFSSPGESSLPASREGQEHGVLEPRG
jgi:hypothetical protein